MVAWLGAGMQTVFVPEHIIFGKSYKHLVAVSNDLSMSYELWTVHRLTSLWNGLELVPQSAA